MENDKEIPDIENSSAWSGLLQLMVNMHESRMDHDRVNHPEHYQASNGMEAIEVIEAFGLNYNLGNAIKYILRSDKKGAALEDLQKAIWYLKRERLRIRTNGKEGE